MSWLWFPQSFPYRQSPFTIYRSVLAVLTINRKWFRSPGGVADHLIGRLRFCSNGLLNLLFISFEKLAFLFWLEMSVGSEVWEKWPARCWVVTLLLLKGTSLHWTAWFEPFCMLVRPPFDLSASARNYTKTKRSRETLYFTNAWGRHQVNDHNDVWYIAGSCWVYCSDFGVDRSSSFGATMVQSWRTSKGRANGPYHVAMLYRDTRWIDFVHMCCIYLCYVGPLYVIVNEKLWELAVDSSTEKHVQKGHLNLSFSHSVCREIIAIPVNDNDRNLTILKVRYHESWL